MYRMIRGIANRNYVKVYKVCDNFDRFPPIKAFEAFGTDNVVDISGLYSVYDKDCKHFSSYLIFDYQGNRRKYFDEIKGDFLIVEYEFGFDNDFFRQSQSFTKEVPYEVLFIELFEGPNKFSSCFEKECLFGGLNVIVDNYKIITAIGMTYGVYVVRGSFRKMDNQYIIVENIESPIEMFSVLRVDKFVEKFLE